MTDHPPDKPAELGSSRDIAQLIRFYREHGESEHVAAVEAALTDDWQTTQQIADRSGKSYNYCRKTLEYLAVELRAERSTRQLPKVWAGVTHKFIWRLPSSPGETT